MAEPVHFLARAKQLGGHVHVGIWAGTALQAENQARPKLGDLVMDPEQWERFVQVLMRGEHAEGRVDIEEPGGG